MYLLNKTVNPSGSYPPIFITNKMLDGCAIVPTNELVSVFQQYNGFVVPTYDGDTVTAFSPNTEAWEAWKSIPTPAIEPTQEERLSALEEAVLGLMGV